jgi:hypothetical protein
MRSNDAETRATHEIIRELQKTIDKDEAITHNLIVAKIRKVIVRDEMNISNFYRMRRYLWDLFEGDIKTWNDSQDRKGKK